jgi:hypothetical protein
MNVQKEATEKVGLEDVQDSYRESLESSKKVTLDLCGLRSSQAPDE